ncbi:MAG: ATP-binding cassette domain-containing protein [Bacilli bacterium]
MEDAVIVKNLNFKYGNIVIFNNLNLEIKKNKITTIIGPNGSGKSTLIKILTGLLKGNGYIKINDYLLLKDNLNDIRKTIGVVFENPDNQFVAQTVMDDIAFTLENMNYNNKDIRKKVEEISSYLGIYDILESNPHSLSGGQKQLVALASALVHDPKLLILDEAFTMLDPLDKDKIYNILISLKDITIINITHDMEETLFSDEIIVMNEGQIVLKGPKEKIYLEEKVLSSLGLEQPFMVLLSQRLIFYNLIDHIIYDMEEMVDVLWK